MTTFVHSQEKHCKAQRTFILANWTLLVASLLVGSVPPSSSSILPRPSPCTRICRYNSNFFDGLVCIGCYRDTNEISGWSQMSSMEKYYALEDSIERCDENKFEGSISSIELKRQTEMWRQVAHNENINEHRSVQSAPNDAKIIGEKESEQMARNTDQRENASRIPSSPCTNICRYKSKFYDGQVCIGCFRDEYDIKNWDKFDNASRTYSLEDALVRCEESAGAFEGSISCSELYRQAAAWSALEDRG